MRFPSCLLDVQLPNRRCFPEPPAWEQPCAQRKRLLQTKKKRAENNNLSTTKFLNILHQGWLAGFSATNLNQRASQQVLRLCASSLPRCSGIKAPGGAGHEHTPGAASLCQPSKELHALPRAGSQLEKCIFRYVSQHNQSESHLEAAEEQGQKMKLQPGETPGQPTTE